MEFKNGKITPTSVREASVFSGFLREQEVARDRLPNQATTAEKGVQLSNEDTYRVFCAIERALKTADRKLSQRQADVAEASIKGLARDALLEVESLVDDFSIAQADALEIGGICNLAFKVLRPYGESVTDRSS